MRYQCVLFDCDGTLVDTEMLASGAYRYLFNQYDIELDIQALHDQYKGKKIYPILAGLAEIYQIKASAEEMEPVFRQELRRLMEAELTTLPGVEALIRRINVPVGVVSHGPREKTEQSMRLSGLAPWFGEHLYSAFHFKSWQPEPGLLLAACRALQVEPEQTIRVDDSVSGVMAGIKAGMQVWYFTTRPDVAVASHSAVHLFSEMKALPALWREANINLPDRSAMLLSQSLWPVMSC